MMKQIKISSPWRNMDEALLKGVVMIVGANDSGKSFLTREIAQKLAHENPVAVIDGDIGQTTMGPPTTQTLSLFLPDECVRHMARWFVGGTSPASHKEQVLIGLARLLEKAKALHPETILIDTTGFVSSAGGGHLLKWHKFDLLVPTTVLALKKDGELETLLEPWRKSDRFRLVEIPVSGSVKKTSAARRKTLRRENFIHYFHDARVQSISLGETGVTGRWPLMKRQLIGLTDRDGFLTALGIVVDANRHEIALKTPISTFENVDMLRTGSLLLDDAMNEQPIGGANPPT